MRPLYNSLARAKLHLGTGHAGLWYEKFCDSWNSQWTLERESGTSGNKKLEWIETVTKNPVGNEVMLDEAVLRVGRLVLAKRGSLDVFTSESRFVTGLGRSHPVENGFAWHATLGVPYLPGSSVKGMIRAWAERDAEPVSSPEHIARVFGSPKGVGQVDLLDALPICRVRLDADVITPHFAGWTAKDPPGDWHGPVPIPFLAAATGTSFLFAVVPRSPAGLEFVEPLHSWLVEALEAEGAGAKTAVGYGRFRLNEEATHELTGRVESARTADRETARRTESLKTPQGRWELVLEGKTERDILELVRIHLSKDPLSDPVERRSFASAVAATGFPALWRKGQKQERETQVGKAKLKERARLVHSAAGRDSAEK